MTEVAVFGTALAKPLNRRRKVTVELPEFVIRAIRFRVDEANGDDTGGDLVDFNDRMATRIGGQQSSHAPSGTQRIPGFTAAMFTWLMEATYQPPEED